MTGLVRLGDVCAIENGFAFDSARFSVERGVPLIRIRDIQESRCSLKYDGSFDERYLVGRGDLLVGMDGEFSPGLWSGEQALLNQRVCRLKPIRERLDTEYLFFAIQEPLRRIQEQTAQTTVKHLSSKQVGEITFALPGIDEQRRIAASLKKQLGAVAVARAATLSQQQEVKALLVAILDAEFQPLSAAPTAALSELARSTSGTTPSRDERAYWTGGTIPWVKTGEIHWDDIVETEEKITVAALERCSLDLLPAGTVLIAMYGQGKTRGQAAVLRVPATINQACFAIRPCEALDPDFVCYWFRFKYAELRRLSEGRGGNQANLNGEVLRRIQFPVVERARQREIVARVKLALREAEQIETAMRSTAHDLEILPSRLLAEAFA